MMSPSVNIVNRSAITVTPTQSFLDWRHAIDPASANDTVESLSRYPLIYLIPDSDEDQDFLRNLEKIFPTMFEEWLGMCADESVWPADRTLGLFNMWFECTFLPLVLDVDDRPLSREVFRK